MKPQTTLIPKYIEFLHTSTFYNCSDIQKFHDLSALEKISTVTLTFGLLFQAQVSLGGSEPGLSLTQNLWKRLKPSEVTNMHVVAYWAPYAVELPWKKPMQTYF